MGNQRNVSLKYRMYFEDVSLRGMKIVNANLSRLEITARRWVERTSTI
jgi:hypothetical protein